MSEAEVKQYLRAWHGKGDERRIFAMTGNALGNAVIDITDLLPADVLEAVRVRLDDEDARAEAYARAHPRKDPVGRRQRVPRPSNLYLMRANGIYKIGLGRSVESRRAALSTASGYAVEVVASWPMDAQAAAEAERALHEHFADKRMNGEWFALDDDDIATIAIMVGGLP